jgi:hypothetical protein
MNLETREIKLFQAPVNPAGNLFPFNDIFTDETGMWMTQTTANLLQFFDYATEEFTITVEIPTPLALPLGVFVTSDGGVWGCEVLGNKIFEYVKATGEILEYDMPAPLQAPAVNRAERDGWMYFSVFIGNALGRINLQTKEIEVIPSGQLGALGSVTAGPSQDGDVWMSFFATTNGLLRYSTEEEVSILRFPNVFGPTGPFAPVGNLPVLGPVLQSKFHCFAHTSTTGRSLTYRIRPCSAVLGHLCRGRTGQCGVLCVLHPQCYRALPAVII